MAELFDFCCANGWIIVGVSLGTIRTSYSDVSVKITFSLYGDISTLSTYMAKMHETPNDVHCAILKEKDQRRASSFNAQKVLDEN